MSNTAHRITRARAGELVAEVLTRVDAINLNDDLAMRVSRVRVFGSYLTKVPTLGDVDLAIDLVRRFPERGSLAEANRRVAATGPRRSGLSFVQWLYYPHIEVLRLIKNRRRAISLHWGDELKTLKCKSRRIYPRRKGRRP